MEYLVLKWIHILSSTLLFGTGLGIAFFMWMANRRGDLAHIAATARVVVIADTLFTAPAVVVQLASGAWLVHMLGIPWSTYWVRTALFLFFLIGMCWLPVLWLQWKMGKIAQTALFEGQSLPDSFHRAMRAWFWLGWPAFLSVIAIFWLMVAKPV